MKHHRRERNRTAGVGLLVCFLLPGSSVGLADDFPSSVRNRTAAQMIELVQQASDNHMEFGELRVRSTRSRILFDATFRPNADGLSWVMLVNVDLQKMKAADAEYEAGGYQKSLERQVRFRGQSLYTVIWTKPKSDPVALQLPVDMPPPGGPTDDSLRPLDEFFQSFLKRHNAAGATVAVAKDGRLVYARGFGFADVTARQPMLPLSEMRIASISKSLTGVAVMILMQKGLLSLDDPVLPLLLKSGYPALAADADQRWNDLTVGHLLHHAGGFDRDESPDPMFQVVEITRQYKLPTTASARDIIRHQLTRPLDFDPGQRYAYSNFGYCLLGRVIEAASGITYEEFVRRHILQPCGMRQTRLGKIRLQDRGAHEVRYHMQKRSLHVPFWAGLPRPAIGSTPSLIADVEAPYGRWDLEVMDAHGGWVSTAPDLLRMVTQLESAADPLLTPESLALMVRAPELKEPTPGRTWYGGGWQVRPVGRSDRPLECHNIWHNGALDGTSTLLVRRWDGFSWAVLFNTDRSADGERLASLCDAQMHQVVNSVIEWPDTDLFATLSVLPSALE
ncbi:MAG: serine hydrolase domain-containing protein [Fuerstiella sp.]